MQRQSILQKTLTVIRIGLCAAMLYATISPAISFAVGAISEGFTTSDNSAPTGTLMSLQDGSKTVVNSATPSNNSNLLGVAGDKPLIAINSGGRQVQVVVTGQTPTLVSDINGSVKAGDFITASPIAGVGMKATTAGLILGTAQDNLKSVSTTQHTTTDKSGHRQTVNIGLVAAQVNVRYYTPNTDKLSPLVPSFMLSLSNDIAGKNVSAVRVVSGTFVLILGFLTISIMLQAGIRSGIIAVGRNPLAHHEVRKSLLDVVLTALGVLALTIMAAYVIIAS